ncbi:hypothetical protein MASR2M78_36280 [Treponema sp.]
MGADTRAEKEGSGLEVRSSPSGADLFVDGTRRGRTPLSIDDLSSGDHYLFLSKDGYVDRRIRVSINDGTRLVLFLELEEARGKLSVRVEPKSSDDSSQGSGFH